MNELKVITNNVPRNLLYGYELTDEQKKDFDYIDQDEFDSHDFIAYRSCIYDICEFMRINLQDPGHPVLFEKWDGYSSDSFFSGVLIRYNPDNNEQVIMARYIS